MDFTNKITIIFGSSYRMAFHQTLLCRHDVTHNNFERTAPTTVTNSLRARSSFYNMDSKISSGKVNFVKNEPMPFCIDSNIKDCSIMYIPNGETLHNVDSMTVAQIDYIATKTC